MSPNGSAPTKVGRYFAPGNPYGFQKGQSGNPGGRSKRRAEIEELARSLAPDAIRGLHEIAVRGRSERVRVAAAEALLDRALGRPVPQLPEADHRPRIARIETVIIDPKRDRDSALGGELEGAVGADLLRLPPVFPIAREEDEDEDVDDGPRLIPGEMPL